jgi:outer membrane protein assembly factor BamD (BamD/ComL family)
LSYSSDTYDQILASLNAFLTNYPTSAYAPEIKKLAGTFADEQKRVDAGEIKYLGQWLSKDEAAKRSVQIRGLEFYNTMQQQAVAGDLVGAMQTFTSIQQDYNTTRAYPGAVTLALQVLTRLQQDLAVRLQTVKDDQVQLKNTIDATAEPEKSNIIAEAKAEQDRNNAIIAAAVSSGAKWVPLIPRSELSIETLQRTAAAEYAQLSAVTVASMNLSITKVDAARTAMSSGDYATADSLLKEATTLWAQNEAAHYWGDQLKTKMSTPAPGGAAAATPRPVTIAAQNAEMTGTTHAATASVSEAAPPFYMTVPGAVGIAAGILVVGGLAASYSQKKSRKAAAAE